MRDPRQSIRRGAGLLAALWLAGCQASAPQVDAPQTDHAFDAGLVTRAPAAEAGRCWADETRPALFETVTAQKVLRPESRDSAGRLLSPAVLRSESHQRELRPRQQVWFPIPCPADIDRQDVFTASLQRALKARGFYGGAVTGVSDGATSAALRRYQAANGLDSAVLSLAAAQALGLVSRP